MSTELATRNDVTSIAEWQMMKEQAGVLVKTGFLPAAIKTPEQAMAIMLTGRELGIPPMQALRGVNVIQGTPAIKPELMLALCVQRIRGFKYRFADCDDKSATFVCSRPEMSQEYVSTFTLDDAKRAGLLGKENYSKWPANMLRWRAVGNALHVVAPDVLVGIYTPDELGAETNEAGELVVAPATTTGEIIDVEPATPDLISSQWSRKIHAMAREVYGDGDEAREQFRQLKQTLLGHANKTTELTIAEGNILTDALQVLIDERAEAAATTNQDAGTLIDDAG
jgi:hypothetical protein